MKLTTVAIAAATLAGAAGIAGSATAGAVLFSEYQGCDSGCLTDGVFFSVKNTGPGAITDVNIDGNDEGGLAAGASTPFVFISDSSAINTPVSIVLNGKTYSGTFSAIYHDIDKDTVPQAVADIEGPEPSVWALMLTGLGALGAALRMRRKAPISA